MIRIEDGGELGEVGDVPERSPAENQRVQDAAQRPHVRPERDLGRDKFITFIICLQVKKYKE